jgi:type I restriction enzyme, S subunit
MSDLVSARFSKIPPPGWSRVDIGNVLRPLSRPISMRDDEVYRLVSVRRRYGGMFDRERLPGRLILTKNLEWVVPGAFILARMQVVHGACCVVPVEMEGAAVSGSYVQFEASRECDLGFFGWLAQIPQVATLFRDASQGVVIEKMTFDLGRWLSFEVNLPPLGEQRRIAEVLDTLDEAIRKTEQLIAKLKQVKQGLLLTRGIDENGELRDPERHPEQFKKSPLGRIPKAWELLALGAVADISSGTTPSRENPSYWKNGSIPWVKTAEVDFSLISDTEEKVNEAALSQTSLRLFPSGTVLVAMYGQGATRGRSAILEVAATTNQACAAIEGFVGRICQKFLFHYMGASYRRLRGLGHGSNQTNLSAALLSEMELQLPPLWEQNLIADRLDSMDARLASENGAVAKLRLLKQGLMEDLLTGRVRVTPLLAGATP